MGKIGKKVREAIRIGMGMYKDFGQNIYPCYKKKTAFMGTINKRPNEIPGAAKEEKGQELTSTEFNWKKDSPVMTLSYLPKECTNDHHRL